MHGTVSKSFVECVRTVLQSRRVAVSSSLGALSSSFDLSNPPTPEHSFSHSLSAGTYIPSPCRQLRRAVSNCPALECEHEFFHREYGELFHRVSPRGSQPGTGRFEMVDGGIAQGAGAVAIQ